MSLQRNYYEVLGLPPSATTDQIKKKYRELARKYHPDIAQDKAFSQRLFTQINQAYSVLADPERRAQYNTTLDSPVRPAPSASAPAASAPSAVVRPASVQAASARPASTQAAPVQAAPKAAAPSPQKMQAITQLLGNADGAIMAAKPLEARGFCMKVLEIDPKNLRALVLLGDALVMMGQPEDAAVQYRNALALSASPMIQSKLARLEQGAASNKTRDLTNKTVHPEANAEKSGGLFGRLLGRK